MFPMMNVQSSTILAMGYDVTNHVMRIQFKTSKGAPGSIYDYQNVESEVFDEILQADSIGSTFDSKIKKQPAKYPYQKVTS